MQHVCGIKCESKECDFIDLTVKLKDIDNWIDKPCPKCGTNLLPKDEYNFAVFGLGSSDEIDELLEEEFVKAGITTEALKMLYAGNILK